MSCFNEIEDSEEDEEIKYEIKCASSLSVGENPDIDLMHNIMDVVKESQTRLILVLKGDQSLNIHVELSYR